MKRKNSTTITVQCDYNEDGSSTAIIPAIKRKRHDDGDYDEAIRSIAKALVMHKETSSRMNMDIRQLNVRVNDLEAEIADCKKKSKYSVMKRIKTALRNS